MTRVRFAPSPTGFLHIGGLRTALYSKLFAMKTGGQFVLRIEDTDRNRLVEGAVKNLLQTLEWANVTPDEGPYLADDGSVQERGDYGPYVQSNRLDIYKKAVDGLIENGHAYHCFCSAERLEEVRRAKTLMKEPAMYDRHCRDLALGEVKKRIEDGEAHVVRMKMPLEGKTRFHDLVRGEVEFENSLIDDQVIVKSDGYPTYHLAVVVDDHHMGITHVLRGEEWLPSTPKHVVLYGAFGWEPPQYAHLPLLLNPDRSKLSKRQGDVAVEDYKRQGYLPEALVNFVALMGWNPTADREIFSFEELGGLFDASRINKGGAVFNREKLDWFNREYIKQCSDERLLALSLPFFEQAGVLRYDEERLVNADGEPVDREAVRRGLSLERTRATTLADFPESTSYLFRENFPIDAAILPWKKSTAENAEKRLEEMVQYLKGCDDAVFSSPETVEKALRDEIDRNGWDNGETLWPTRVALTGLPKSPSPFEVIWALGKDKSLGRLERAVKLLHG